jgi:general secretion pathway protein K
VASGEGGYASIAAIAAIAVLATLAVSLLEGSERRISAALTEVEAAKASAAADAGLPIALDGLLVSDRAGRWSIDGRQRHVDFAGSRLTITIEDERGKVPLNLLDEQTAMRLVQTAGMGSGEAAKVAADSLLDWTDEDEDIRRFGAEADFYRQQGIRPPNGPWRSIDELARVRGFNPVSVERLRSYVTVNFGSGGFDARFAQPDAIGVMLEGGTDSPEAIQRRRELAGQRVAIELGDPVELIGRPLTIAVVAQRPSGARASQRTVIELTGSPRRPYVIRSFE